MTQIIGVITQDYAMLVSDRLLTYGSGHPRAGEEFDADTCKLVSLCDMSGIGYSGLAELEGKPTHEWIATTLAHSNCRDANAASQVLVDAAAQAVRRVRVEHRRLMFLFSGWAYFGEPPALRSHFCLVTNTHDERGQMLATPRDHFRRLVRSLKDNQQLLLHVIGQPVLKSHAAALERNMRRLLARDIGPSDVLRLLAKEILFTHQSQQRPNVGEKLLAFCIPKLAVERQLKTGVSSALAQLANEDSVSFSYFDPAYSELRQYGPTFVCGEWAVTDVETESDPARDFQSSQMRILSLPKRKEADPGG